MSARARTFPRSRPKAESGTGALNSALDVDADEEAIQARFEFLRHAMAAKGLKKKVHKVVIMDIKTNL